MSSFINNILQMLDYIFQTIAEGRIASHYIKKWVSKVI